MLIISNDDTARVLTMTDTIRVLEQAYAELATGEAVCRPRIDIHIPTSDPQKTYQWGTMEGGSRSGYFAIRMKSDVIYEQSYGGTVTQEKYCVEPGTYCGLVLLIRVETGEPLALLNDGWLQHFRVGADSAIGTRHMARKDSGVVGMLGSGGMARSHIAALREVMDIKEIKVYSPTEENRIGFAAEMTETYGIETTPVASAQAAHEGADILMGCTDATGPVIFGEWLEPGTHITAIGGRLDEAARDKVDIALRLGTSPAAQGFDGQRHADEWIAYDAAPLDGAPEPTMRKRGYRSRREAIDGKTVLMEDVASGVSPGRSADSQITFSERGNIQGAQFFAVAGLVYERAKSEGLGRDIPTEWLLQDIRD